jgi:alkylation response protein AidB-like acyl-CoA dehydrogenase
MDDPGISASPIELIIGNRHFCQVWLDNVKVPKANLVHELHKGWTVGKAVLSHERKLMSESNDSASAAELSASKVLDKFVDRNAKGAIDNPELRTDLVKHHMNLRAIELCQQRIFEEYMAGEPTALAMVMKYIGTEEIKRKDELMLAAMGICGMAWPEDPDAPPSETQLSKEEAQIPRNWAMDKTYTIAGGSSEIQLNILAKNVLGLPD